VVNALLAGGDVTLRASDRDDATLDLQTRVELPVIGTGEPRLRAIFDGVANAGTVRVPLAGQFWGDTFGAITGQYGIGWHVNIGSAGACGPGRPRCHAAANTARGVGTHRSWPRRIPCLPVSGDQRGPARCLAAGGRRPACC
jgi:hypothetical protein